MSCQSRACLAGILISTEVGLRCGIPILVYIYLGDLASSCGLLVNDGVPDEALRLMTKYKRASLFANRWLVGDEGGLHCC